MIVKQIVQKSGGDIHVRSDGAGTGSKFIFYMKMLAMPDPLHAGIAGVQNNSNTDYNAAISLGSVYNVRHEINNTKSD